MTRMADAIKAVAAQAVATQTAFDADRELGYMYDKLDYFGQKQWLNIILPAWEKAYRTAHGEVLKALSVKTSEGLFSPIEIIGAVVGPMHTFASLAFIPVAAGLKKLTSSEPTYPPKPTTSPEEFVTDRKLEFGRMLAACAQAILKLRERAKSGAGVSAQDFETFLSRSLLSPIWYPPREPDQKKLAESIERRMWAKAGKTMIKDPDYEMDMSGMADRLEKLNAVKSGGYTDLKRMARYNFGARQLIFSLNHGYLHQRLSPWVDKELRGPDPFEYAVPRHVQKYVDVFEAMTTAYETTPRWLPNAPKKPTPETVMQQVPYVRLDWSNVPDKI
jgi:hypothetical protein